MKKKKNVSFMKKQISNESVAFALLGAVFAVSLSFSTAFFYSPTALAQKGGPAGSEAYGGYGNGSNPSTTYGSIRGSYNSASSESSSAEGKGSAASSRAISKTTKSSTKASSASSRAKVNSYLKSGTISVNDRINNAFEDAYNIDERVDGAFEMVNSSNLNVSLGTISSAQTTSFIDTEALQATVAVSSASLRTMAGTETQRIASVESGALQASVPVSSASLNSLDTVLNLSNASALKAVYYVDKNSTPIPKTSGYIGTVANISTKTLSIAAHDYDIGFDAFEASVAKKALTIKTNDSAVVAANVEQARATAIANIVASSGSTAEQKNAIAAIDSVYQAVKAIRGMDIRPTLPQISSTLAKAHTTIKLRIDPLKKVVRPTSEPVLLQVGTGAHVFAAYASIINSASSNIPTTGNDSERLPSVVSSNAGIPSCTMSVQKSSVTLGETTTLLWTSTNAMSLRISNNFSSAVANNKVNGSSPVTPGIVGTATYTGVFTSQNGQTVRCSANVSVAQVQNSTDSTTAVSPQCTMTVSPSTIRKGSTATLFWTSSNANSLTISNTLSNAQSQRATTGSNVVSPDVSTAYTALFTAANGKTVTCKASVTVTGTADSTNTNTQQNSTDTSNETPARETSSSNNTQSQENTTYSAYDSNFNTTQNGNALQCAMSIAPTSIQKGATATLSWSSSNASSVRITNSFGPAAATFGPNGSSPVTPQVTGTPTYTGVFSGKEGQKVTCSASVRVTQSGQE